MDLDLNQKTDHAKNDDSFCSQTQLAGRADLIFVCKRRKAHLRAESLMEMSWSGSRSRCTTLLWTIRGYPASICGAKEVEREKLLEGRELENASSTPYFGKSTITICTKIRCVANESIASADVISRFEKVKGSHSRPMALLDSCQCASEWVCAHLLNLDTLVGACPIAIETATRHLAANPVCKRAPTSKLLTKAVAPAKVSEQTGMLKSDIPATQLH